MTAPRPFPTILNTPADRLRFFIVDVFTAAPLAGNQLGVFVDARGLNSAQMQMLTREMNYAESVFVLPAEADGDVHIRIFTPATELPFAGHPTLGSAVLLGELLDMDAIRLETGVGIVPVALTKGEGPTFGRMQQPIPTTRPFPRAPELLAALGVGGSELPVDEYVNGPEHAFVTLTDRAAVAALRPDMAALERIPVLASCIAGAGKEWTNRMFAPSRGVPEDPATGSAAGPLAVHLARHGRIAWGDEIVISQGEQIGRPSTLYARATGSNERIERVEVGGHAVVVAEGSFRRSAIGG